MNDQIERISNKIKELKRKDSRYEIFGSGNHRYALYKPISLQEIRRFEAKHNITLPSGYVNFLTLIGDGGVGPHYGLEPLENALYRDPDYLSQELLDPSKPFLYTEPWNMKFDAVRDDNCIADAEMERYAQFEESYFAKERMNGTISICNFGCGVNIVLVVNGAEYGNVWMDDRSSDYGIHPYYNTNDGRLNFLDWYEKWLDSSLLKLQASGKPQTEESRESEEKPWWKFW